MRTSHRWTLALLLLGPGCHELIGADFDDLRPQHPGDGHAGGSAGGRQGASAVPEGGSAGTVSGSAGASGNAPSGTGGSGQLEAGSAGFGAGGGSGGAGGRSDAIHQGGTTNAGTAAQLDDGGEGGVSGESTGDAGMGTAGRLDGAAGASGTGGDDSTSAPPLLGGPAPGTPSSSNYIENVEFGYYTAPNPYVQDLCVDLRDLGPVCAGYGSSGSKPFVIGPPAPCGTHGWQTEFASFGTVFGIHWYPSVNDFRWEWGLDDKNRSTYGIENPWPASWNGMLIAYEGGTFSVDWEGALWKEPSGVRSFDFRPELDWSSPVYPIVGRWRREYGERLGVFQNGTFYVDWDGDNAWDPSLDRSYAFGIGQYPVAADFVPGGNDEIGTYEDGTWYIDWNGNGRFDGLSGSDMEKVFGDPGSFPVVARDGWLRDCY